jgi:hypothetical protein
LHVVIDDPKEADMRKIWIGVACVAVIAAKPAFAQAHRQNFVECAKAVGLNPVAGSSRPHKWRYHGEAQHMAFMDCLARKASLAAASSAKRPQRAAR